MTKNGFIHYLENTLIPDLRESKLDGTADDFEECVRHMKGLSGLVYHAEFNADDVLRAVADAIQEAPPGENPVISKIEIAFGEGGPQGEPGLYFIMEGSNGGPWGKVTTIFDNDGNEVNE